ncbi:MAG: UDP-2,3-diacylglucosamine diphosphatase [Patescibacteria group bacterium]|nr:UDP-2,3-diacylglucosamine diphosphatase [Patescibacteria group bacterium]MDE2116506.1 UDP-2,3-diacylglucosamine diphosphatase [Patescibacteria group bacterium]
MPDTHILLVSDIHLGSRMCQTDRILSLLEKSRFDALVINGDLFDSDKAKKLTPEHWQVVARLAEIAARKPVFLIGGNHGRDLDTIAKRIGITVQDDYAFTLAGTRFLCIHGDEFDPFVKHMPLTSEIFSQIFYLIQRVNGPRQRSSMFIKKLSKHILRVSTRTRRLAFKRGKARNVNVIICSHTHVPHVETKDDVLYINSGSFCESPSTYVTISKTGKAELCEV